jgi:flavin-binding protein dodecin
VQLDSISEREIPMSISRVTEITSFSTRSFEDAVESGVSRAIRTFPNVEGVRIQEQKVLVEGDMIAAYRVNMQVTFIVSN